MFLVYISESGDMAFNKDAIIIMGNPEFVQLFYESEEKKVGIAPAQKIDTTIFNALENHLRIKKKQGFPYVEAYQFFTGFKIPIVSGVHRAIWSKDAQMLVFNLEQFEFLPRRGQYGREERINN